MRRCGLGIDVDIDIDVGVGVGVIYSVIVPDRRLR